MSTSVHDHAGRVNQVENDRKKLLDLANKLYDQKKYQESEAAFEALIARDPACATAWIGRAKIARQVNDHVRALDLASTAARHNRRDPWIAHFIAVTLRELERHADAEMAFQALVEQNPGFAYGWRDLGYSARRRGHGDFALECFRRAAACQPENAQLLHDVAVELLRGGRHDDADAILAQLMKAHPSYAPCWRDAAMDARRRGRHDLALEYFRGALQGDPRDPWTRINISFELRELGRWDEAATELRALVAAKPDFGYGWRDLALCHRQSGDGPRALEALRRATACEPKNRQFEYELASELRAAGAEAEAERLLAEIVAKHPKFCSAWRDLAMLARARGAHETALERFTAADGCEPGERWTQHNIGLELRSLGCIGEAEEVFRRLVERHPQFGYAWRDLGFCLYDRGARPEALECLSKAAAHDPENLSRQYAIVDYLRRMKDDAAVESLTRRLLEERSDDSRSYLLRFHALRKSASKPELIALLERAAFLDAGNFAIKLSLADELRSAWRLDEARALYAAIGDAQPANAAALLGLALTARAQGDRASALALLERAAALDGRNQWAAIEFARESMEVGRLEQAVAFLREWLAKRPNAFEASLFLVELLRRSGVYEEALQVLQEAAERHPASIKAQKALAVEEFNQGRVLAAKTRLDALLAQHPNDPLLLETLGDFANAADDLVAAAVFYGQAFDPEAPGFWLSLKLASVWFRLGETEQADGALRAAERKFGLVPEIIMAKAKMSREREGWRTAADLLEQGVGTYAGHFELWFQLQSARIALGEFARVDAAVAAPHFPLGAREQAKVRFLHGLMEATRWRLTEAARDFTEALAFNPRDSWINDWAARVALLQGDVVTCGNFLAMARRHDTGHLVRTGGAVKPSQSLLGQMLDEYRIDTGALRGLQRALHADAPALANLVREYPDYTPAAIAYVLSLRQKGALAQREEETPYGPIPRRIAQFWDKDMPVDVEALCDSWPKQNPGFDYRRFSLAEARRFLAEHAPKIVSAFDRAREPAMKSDLLRLAFLYFEGGYYADADDRCLRPLAALDGDRVSLLCYQEDFATIGNNFIGAAPGHPAIGETLKQATEAVLRGDNDMIFLATGPGVLTRRLAAFIAGDETRLRGMRILDRHEICDTVAIHCVASYKFKGKHWARMKF